MAGKRKPASGGAGSPAGTAALGELPSRNAGDKDRSCSRLGRRGGVCVPPPGKNIQDSVDAWRSSILDSNVLNSLSRPEKVQSAESSVVIICN